jgi:hypothetical protein
MPGNRIAVSRVQTGINFAETGHSELVVFDAKPGGPPVVSSTENKVCGVGGRELVWGAPLD